LGCSVDFGMFCKEFNSANIFSWMPLHETCLKSPYAPPPGFWVCVKFTGFIVHTERSFLKRLELADGSKWKHCKRGELDDASGTGRWHVSRSTNHSLSNPTMLQSKDTQTKSRNHAMLMHFEVVTMLQDADSGSASQKDLVQSLGRKVLGSACDVHPR